MPGIKISRDRKRELPKDQLEGLEDFLWDKSGGLCHLCDRKLNRASDEIDIDHDVPVEAGGLTDRSNLSLAHDSCNRTKKNNPTVDVKPYLKLKGFSHDRGNVIKYADAQEHFEFEPQSCVLTWSVGDDTAQWQFPGGSERQSNVYAESDGRGRDYHYTFVEAPRDAIFNDDECQPRSIKLTQVWAIYADTEDNPLHEPPSCRILPDGAGGSVRLVMFDGQHKSVACWMHGKTSVVLKVYLDLDKDRTIKLVNSIQSRIKKLPLSSFEHAMKFSEEWSADLLRYEDEVGTDDASEAGLIDWLKPEQRKRAKDAAQAALLKDLLEDEDLKFLQFVQLAGREKGPHAIITETAFKKKVLEKLRHMPPLTEKGEEWQLLRAREAENIKFALNHLVEKAFLDSEGKPDLTGTAATRRDRMKYQSALAYASFLIQKLYASVLSVDQDSRALLEKEPSEDQAGKIRKGIDRIVEHPIWTCDFEKSAKTKAVRDALQKNQDAANAFRAVELRGDYVNGSESLPSDWAEGK